MSNESTPGKSPRIHPLVAVAAISVTAFCLTGIAGLTGHLGNSLAENQVPVAPASTATTPALTTAQAPAVNHRPAPHPAPAAAPAPAPAPARAVETAPGSDSRASIDTDSATVVSIQKVSVAASNNGLGAAAGAIVGGVVGHQIGNGRGNDVATVLGAIGGGFAGNAAESKVREQYRYDVTVRRFDGSTTTLHYSNPPAFAPGDRISLRAAG